jgi:hypothetical protein
MKRIVALGFMVLMLASCSTLKPTQRTVETYFSDYREYAKDGFLVSPCAYTYDFESVGELNIVITPAKVMVERPSSNYYNSAAMINTLDYEVIPYSEMVDMAVKEAKSKGADAIVNFSITKEQTATEKYYHINGFCIKRK